MEKLLVLSVVAFLFFSYKFMKVLQVRDAPKSNKVIAWFLYSGSIIGLITLNIVP